MNEHEAKELFDKSTSIYNSLANRKIIEKRNHNSPLPSSTSISSTSENYIQFQELLHSFLQITKQDFNGEPEFLVNSWISLGEIYWNGFGTEINEIEAFNCFKIAANEKYRSPQAAYTLANKLYHYYNKYEESLFYLKKAKQYSFEKVGKKDPTGEHNYLLGLMYYHGRGVKQDKLKSFKLHQKSADCGNSNAMFELYVYYSAGIACNINHLLAHQWLSAASNHNHYRALYNVGSSIARGLKIEGINDTYAEKPKLKLAASWYQRAAKEGNGLAAATLGVMYFQGLNKDGDGLEYSRENALEYLNIAEQLGFDVHGFLSKIGIDFTNI